MTGRLIVIALIHAAGTTVAAQAVSFTPSVGASAVYDDNVFHQPGGDGDVVTRFSPRFDSSYKSERLSLSGRYALDADRFARHPELTTAHGRQEAAVDVHYNSSRRFVLGGTASLAEAAAAVDVAQVSGLAPGRARTRRMTLNPSATYQFGPRADVKLGYTITTESLQGGVDVTTHTATSALERHLSDRNSLQIEYSAQQYVFGTDEASSSQALTAGWTRDISRATILSLRAGPRVTAGTLAPEISALLSRQTRAGSFSASYLRTQTTLIGLAGIADTNGVTATIENEPRPRVRLQAASRLLHTRQAGLSSIAYRFSLGCAWPISRHIGAEAGYDTDLQRGNLYTRQSVQSIRRNLATVRIVVTKAPGAAAR
jgi:hypothetical protein